MRTAEEYADLAERYLAKGYEYADTAQVHATLALVAAIREANLAQVVEP